MKQLSALFFGLIMITMSLSGCFGGDDAVEEPDDPVDEQIPTTGGELDDDWNVHFAATSGDLPACDNVQNGRLYYVEDSGNFQVCKTSGWEAIEISGADGASGTNGTDGNDGVDGTSGTNGTDGNDGVNGSAAAVGADGETPMFNVTASTTCPNGGKRVAIGEDIDENGVLDAAEAAIIVDICDGVHGVHGDDGADGTDGVHGDDGTDGTDGVHGNDGTDGVGGTNGTDGANALISTSVESAGSNCANGGTRIDVGVDDNDDGSLQTIEVDQTTYICDGSDGSSSASTMLTSTSNPTLTACDAGGRIMKQGFDNGDGGGTAQNGILETGEVDYTTTYCSNFLISMVKDINAGQSGSYVSYLTAVGNTLYFQADEGGNGIELWKSDGTTAGTVVVKDIYSASGGGSPIHLTAVGNTLYFTAYDGINGRELWKSDGTAAGTVMVKDISSTSSDPNWLTAVGNTLYFTAYDGGNGIELWKSDGTTSGTVLVKDIRNGGDSSPQYLTAVGNTLYFQANDGINGRELWKSDGTTSGTVLVKDINSGSNSSSFSTYPWDNTLTAVGNMLYFQADDGTNGAELWKSDGTASGTVMVKDINSGSGSSSLNYLTAVGNTLYFSASDVTNGQELWKSDGTSAGTLMVKDINSGANGSSPTDLTAVANTLYFSANDGTNGLELWKSDGTTSGTVMVKDIRIGSQTWNMSSFPQDLTAVGNVLYFQANAGTHGAELWKSDGTSAGTVLINIPSSSSPQDLIAVDNILYFQADAATTGNELWSAELTSDVSGVVKTHEITYS